jgi:hypothetical protein
LYVRSGSGIRDEKCRISDLYSGSATQVAIYEIHDEVLYALCMLVSGLVLQYSRIRITSNAYVIIKCQVVVSARVFYKREKKNNRNHRKNDCTVYICCG